jgi:hypothetical protein
MLLVLDTSYLDMPELWKGVEAGGITQRDGRGDLERCSPKKEKTTRATQDEVDSNIDQKRAFVDPEDEWAVAILKWRDYTGIIQASICASVDGKITDSE